MGSNMLGNVLGRIRSETVLLSLIIVLSITSSVILMSDAMIGLATERYGLSLTVLRAFELTFASTWFLLSMNITRQSNRLRKTLHRLYSQSTLSGVEEEQKKGEIAKLVRDLIVFYRDNYFKFAVVTILATGVSFSIILTVTYLVSSVSGNGRINTPPQPFIEERFCIWVHFMSFIKCIFDVVWTYVVVPKGMPHLCWERFPSCFIVSCLKRFIHNINTLEFSLIPSKNCFNMIIQIRE